MMRGGLPTVAILPSKNGAFAQSNLKLVDGILSGSIDTDYDFTVSDVRGHILEKFHGVVDAMQHALATNAKGLLLVELKSNRGIDRIRFSRI